MGKMEQNYTSQGKPGPKPKYASSEERRLALLETNRRYRLTERGRQQKQKDDAKYLTSEAGKQVRRAAQRRYRGTEKYTCTKRRYEQSDKGQALFQRYWSSPSGKARARAKAALRRHLIQRQNIRTAFVAEIKLWYENTPKGMEVDHIVPVVHPLVCGLHVPWNFQYLTRGGNRHKGNRWEPA